MDNLKVKILIGIPASGKSTWAKQFIEKNDKWVIVSRDDFRYMLKNRGVCDDKHERLISELVDDTITSCLAARLNIIIDATNVKHNYINHYCELVADYADVEYMLFDVPLETCIKRDADRTKKVGEQVINRMYKDLLILKDTFSFQSPLKNKVQTHLVPDFVSDLPSAVMFDIDGTLALMNNRGPFDWDLVDRDNVNDIVAEQINYHKQQGRKIIILTGRNEEAHALTKEWLDFYGIEYDFFWGRKKDDYRKDNIIKKELFLKHIKDNFNVLCVYDDRLQVVKMWYKLGVFCFNVNQGMKKF